jgi:hypothetical protein
MMKKLLFAFLNLVVLNTVFGAEPTIAPSNLAIGTIQCNKATVSWTNGNGGWRLVL